MQTYLLKIYHSFDKGKLLFRQFLNDIGQTMDGKIMIFGLNYRKGEFSYSLSTTKEICTSLESRFYTYFNDFQIVPDDKEIWSFDTAKTVIGEIRLENSWFFPFKTDNDDNTEFVFNIFRSFENFDMINDRFSMFVEINPIREESSKFFLKSKFTYFFFRFSLFFRFFRYIFTFKTASDWKDAGEKYFESKFHKELFETRIFLVSQSSDISRAKAKLESIFNNFLVFKNYPLNQFSLKIVEGISPMSYMSSGLGNRYMLSSEEVSSFYHFPKNPKQETSLLKVTARKLALPIGVPTSDYYLNGNSEVQPKEYPKEMNIIGISDYRSITVPVGIYDEDRLKHTYIIGKTGVGKSKFMMSLLLDDIKQGRGIGLIDPHGDNFEEALMHIPENRKKDVIIFDPTDEKYPFCMNPLDIKSSESKQVLAKGFIDIFKKFFGSNWNPRLEHVLRMIFLALLDRPESTIFDMIRALTDKDFRYDMIEHVKDDVVKNFWTNEFAGWSQQFNNEAIMPILNKVGQLLSIDMIKNIFISKENKLDFRKMLDEGKILLVKLPKGKLQEEIMGFLGAMLITKIFQAAMGRQTEAKDARRPFFLYVDEFQNFATETFNEILSEARKYGLGLTVAHQFIRQIPQKISEALFGNVGTLVSFRISPEDAIIMKQQFDPFLESYDLANLNQREFYCKMLVRGQVKDPFSLKTLYIKDPDVDRKYIESIYDFSRKQYSRSLEEAKKVAETQQKDVIKKIEEFVEPII